MPGCTSFEVAFSLTRQVSFERVGRNRVHRHSFFEPCMVIAGQGEFEHRGAVYPLGPGVLFSADPGVYHEIRSATRDLRVFFLAFHVSPVSSRRPRRAGLGAGESQMIDFIRSHRSVCPDQAHLITLFEHAAQLSRPDAVGQVRPFHQQVSLLLITQIVAALSESVPVDSPAVSDGVFHDRVSSMIERRLHEPFRTAAIAEECGVSERTLRRRWRRSAARSLAAETNFRRVERARHLLLLPEMSVGEAGYQVGMPSGAQFSRLFRKHTGLTPSAYREHRMLRTARHGTAGPSFRTEFLDGDQWEYDA